MSEGSTDEVEWGWATRQREKAAARLRRNRAVFGGAMAVILLMAGLGLRAVYRSARGICAERRGLPAAPPDGDQVAGDGFTLTLPAGWKPVEIASPTFADLAAYEGGSTTLLVAKSARARTRFVEFEAELRTEAESLRNEVLDVECVEMAGGDTMRIELRLDNPPPGAPGDEAVRFYRFLSNGLWTLWFVTDDVEAQRDTVDAIAGSFAAAP